MICSMVNRELLSLVSKYVSGRKVSITVFAQQQKAFPLSDVFDEPV